MTFNPWILLGVVLFYVASLGGTAWKAYDLGGEHVIAQQAQQQADIKKGQDEALQAAAAEIAKIDVRQVTIRQQAETITREVPVYRDCQHDPDGLRLVNEALTGDEPSADGIRKGQLP